MSGGDWTDHGKPSTPPIAFPNGDQGPAPGRRGGRRLAFVAGAVAAVGLGAGGALILSSVDDLPPEPPAATATDVGGLEPAREPAPEVDTAPAVRASVQDVNWARQPWPTTCTPMGLNEEVQATLSPGSEPGIYEYVTAHGGEGPPMTFRVWVDDVVYVDVDGDGEDEAVFKTSCFFGNDFGHYVEAWKLDEAGVPEALPHILAWTKFDGQIDLVENMDGALRITTAEPAEGQETPHLSGYPVAVVTHWTFDGAAWVADERSRTTQGVPECAAPNSTPESAVDCLVAAAHTGDSGAALLAATSEVVSTIREAIDNGSFAQWEYDGCNSGGELGTSFCSFYEPGSGDFHGVLIELWVSSGDRGWFIEGIDFYG